MYSVLIVEDEYYVRAGIKYRVDWAKLGLRVLGEADNGLSALDFLRHTPVDILLTDIRMPEMDGLSLIKAVKSLYPRMRIAILSGYDDFGYLQAAIRMGVSDYIQKPIDEAELTDTLCRITATLDTENRAISETQPLNEQLARELERQRFYLRLERLFAGQKTDFDALPGERFAAAVIDPGQKYAPKALEEWVECLAPMDDLRLFGDLNHGAYTLVRLLICGADINQTRLKHCAQALCLDLRGALGNNATVRCGLSEPVDSLPAVAQACQQAMEALKNKLFSAETVLLPDAPQDIDELNEAVRIIFELREALSQRNRRATQRLVEALFSDAWQHANTLSMIMRYLHDIVYEYVVRYQLESSSLMAALNDPHALLSYDSMKQARAALVPMILDFFFSRSFLDDSIITQVKLYISQHPDEDLKVSTLGQLFFLSPNYLSFLFKKETGFTQSGLYP